MVKIINTGLAALIAATSIVAAATPAAAEDHWGHGGGYSNYSGYGGGYDRGYGGDRWEHRDHDNAAPLIIGGILGLGLLAAIASSHSDHRQNSGAYASGYDQNSDYHPDVCTQTRQAWDSYYGRYVTRAYRVAC